MTNDDISKSDDNKLAVDDITSFIVDENNTNMDVDGEEVK